MSETILVAIITGVMSLVGVLINVYFSYRTKVLELEMQKQNASEQEKTTPERAINSNPVNQKINKKRRKNIYLITLIALAVLSISFFTLGLTNSDKSESNSSKEKTEIIKKQEPKNQKHKKEKKKKD